MQHDLQGLPQEVDVVVLATLAGEFENVHGGGGHRDPPRSWIEEQHEDDAVAACYPVDRLLTPRPGTLLRGVDNVTPRGLRGEKVKANDLFTIRENPYSQRASSFVLRQRRVGLIATTTVGYITLTLEAYPEGDVFVSRCRELDVASCGDSAGEAIEAVKEATLLYLNTIEEIGDRERIFAERGIKIQEQPSQLELHESVPANGLAGSMVVPLPLAA